MTCEWCGNTGVDVTDRRACNVPHCDECLVDCAACIDEWRIEEPGL